LLLQREKEDVILALEIALEKKKESVSQSNAPMEDIYGIQYIMVWMPCLDDLI